MVNMRRLAMLALAPLVLTACDDAPAADSPTDIADSSVAVDTDVAADTDPVDVETPRRCNGHAALCERRLDEVTLPATHNAMSSAEADFILPNHHLGLQRQLDDGVRGLLLDVWDWTGHDGLWLCHGFCELGATPLADGLGAIATFLETHPHEVLVLVLEDYVSAAALEGAFDEAGLARWLYTHDPAAGWPTLGAMIDADTRLVVSASGAEPPPTWLHHAWDLMWDTPYEFRRADDFSCVCNRGCPATDGQLFLVNHWLSNPAPAPDKAPATNAFDVLYGRADECRTASGRQPTLLAVDFYSEGDLFEAVDALNGVATAPVR